MKITAICGVRIFLIVLSVVAVTSCDMRASRLVVKEWTEDVKLNTGKNITIYRFVAFNAANALGGGAYSATEIASTLEILLMNPLKRRTIWSEPLIPLVLYEDEVTKELTIVATTTACEAWSQRGRPKLLYWEYRLGDAGWREVPLSPASMGRKTNLLFDYRGDLGVEHVTEQDRIRLQSRPKIVSRFKSIEVDAENNCGK